MECGLIEVIILPSKYLSPLREINYIDNQGYTDEDILNIIPEPVKKADQQPVARKKLELPDLDKVNMMKNPTKE
jgi:hypothetical protein